MLREPLSLDIAYPIQWHESRVNLTELAKLRYIHGWSRQELARHYGRTLNAITNYCQIIRRKDFDLDGLTIKEKEQMGLSKMISLPITLAFLAVGTGNLPWVLRQVRKAQFELIQESKASKWPKAMRLSDRSN